MFFEHFILAFVICIDLEVVHTHNTTDKSKIIFRNKYRVIVIKNV